MSSIIQATIADAALLAQMGRQTFIESHGHSAAPADISKYLDEKYTIAAFENELSDPANRYHIICHQQQPVGYSKIIFNTPNSEIPLQNITKLERIYLLKEFYQLKLGACLFNFNVELAKPYGQAGMWLYVWTENERAIRFYTSNGFVIAGSYDFKISETHSNPNHLLFLQF